MGGVGTGVVAATYPACGAGDSETLAFPDSNFESEGLSVLGGEVSPWIKGAEEEEEEEAADVGCAAK